jgi:hypothetical protein
MSKAHVQESEWEIWKGSFLGAIQHRIHLIKRGRKEGRILLQGFAVAV